MRKFIKKIVLFIAYTLILFIVFFGAFMLINRYNSSHIPAINFSNSYSFNEKMMFLNDKQGTYEVMAIGSSMALNNLHSETITDNLNTDSYINISSWGLNNEEIYQNLKLAYPHYKPTTILFPGSMYDFNYSVKIFKEWTIKSFLEQTFPKPLYYFLTFDLKYYVDNFKYARNVRNYPHNYDYLNFDEFGAVNFYSETFDIDSLRYNSKILDGIQIDENQYAYLDSIVTFCNSNNIKLIYADVPLREDLRNNLTELELEIFDNHEMKIRKLLKNQTYIDSESFDLDKSLYFDNTHLTASGAKFFTRKMLSSK